MIAMSQRLIESLSRGLVGAEGRNRDRKKKRKGKGRSEIFALCKSQGPACEAFVQDGCGNNATCLAAGLQCCEQIEICEFTAFIACANAVAT